MLPLAIMKLINVTETTRATTMSGQYHNHAICWYTVLDSNFGSAVWYYLYYCYNIILINKISLTMVAKEWHLCSVITFLVL